jgi:hypothetical protein
VQLKQINSFRVDEWRITTFLCPGISYSHLGTCFGFNDVPCPHYPAHTESNETLSRCTTSKTAITLNTNKYSNYIFHTGSFPKVV